MKKHIRILSCFLCCLITMLMMCGCQPSAESIANDTETQQTSEMLGDADSDGEITIIDAVTIQRHLAGFLTLSKSAQKLADVNNSGEVDITDVTFIQRFLASMNVPYRVGQPIGNSTVDFERFTKDSKITEVMNDEAFVNFGRLLFPVNSGYYSGTTLDDLYLTWYGHPDTDKTVEIVNYLKEQALNGNQIFYDIYTDEEKAADPDKNETGLFFFKGEENKPFAICNAGGGMVFVGAMQDSFPHALELSKKGYNAFALIYRPGYQSSVEDLSRAIAFIFEHAEELGVNTDDYSLWGGSAGARMADWVGTYGTESFGEKAYPKPAAVIMQYTGLSEVTGDEPPTYNCVGTSDGIASWRTMQNRISAIKVNGTDAEIDIYDGLPHGFGLGIGTIAEGWLDNAVAFWERNMTKQSSIGIPQTGLTDAVPISYDLQAQRQGTVVPLPYGSKNYAENGEAVSKTAYVYLPYGYDENDTKTRYDILYLMHGWGGYAGDYLSYGNLKNMLDHMIGNRDTKPCIVVFASFYNDLISTDFSASVNALRAFHQDLQNDLMPAVERTYHTYAKGTSKEALTASRDHRAFGGFSLGSVTTWMQFCNSYDYFRYYLPMSGSCWYYGGYGDFQIERNADYLEQLIKDHALDDRGYFIYFAVGTNDSVKSQSIDFANELLSRRDTFTPEHFVFYQKDGGYHDFDAAREFIYNALPLFFGD